MITINTPKTIPNDMNSVDGVRQNIVSVESTTALDSKTSS